MMQCQRRQRDRHTAENVGQIMPALRHGGHQHQRIDQSHQRANGAQRPQRPGRQHGQHTVKGGKSNDALHLVEIKEGKAPVAQREEILELAHTRVPERAGQIIAKAIGADGTGGGHEGGHEVDRHKRQKQHFQISGETRMPVHETEQQHAQRHLHQRAFIGHPPQHLQQRRGIQGLRRHLPVEAQRLLKGDETRIPQRAGDGSERIGHDPRRCRHGQQPGRAHGAGRKLWLGSPARVDMRNAKQPADNAQQKQQRLDCDGNPQQGQHAIGKAGGQRQSPPGEPRGKIEEGHGALSAKGGTCSPSSSGK